MEIHSAQPTTKGSPDTFTGDVWHDAVVEGKEPSRLRISIVRFAPGARSAWHAHTVGQTLYVIEGLGRVQSRGGEVMEIRPGEIVYTAPNEMHWHGAAPDRFMTHLAIWEVDADGKGAMWGAHVTDEDYRTPVKR